MTANLRGRIWLILFTMALAVAWALMLSSPHRAGKQSFLDPVEAALVNARMATFGVTPPQAPVVVVAVDDEMLAQANPLGRGRSNMADLIDAVASQGAATLVLDVLLSDPHELTSDQELALSLSQTTSVIASAGIISNDTASNALPKLSDVLQPLRVFTDSADTGIVNISTDASGVPRHIPIVFLSPAGLQPSLAAQAASVFLRQPLQLAENRLTLGSRTIALDQGFHMPLRLLGPRGTVPTVPAFDVLNDQSKINLTGKLVVIGVTATALGDRFPSPFDPALPGVEVMATAIAQLIDGPGLRRDSPIRNADMIVGAALAALCAGVAISLPLTVGLSLGAGVLAVCIGAVWMAFSYGIWMSAALPLAAAGPPLLASSLVRYAHEKRKSAAADRSVDALKKFQSPILASRIAQDPDFLATPQKQDLVICFVDLSGFTQLSQTLGEVRTENLLKRFHEILADIAEEHDGMVLNFMGDGALLIFGVLSEADQIADSALQAAIEMIGQTRRLGQDERLSEPLSARIGLHYGPVILSRMGGNQHQQLTVTGDSVNLCSRLLEITKEQRATMAATDEFMVEIHRTPDMSVDEVATLTVRGRSGSVVVSLWRF
jgi:adenylate cyclase